MPIVRDGEAANSRLASVPALVREMSVGERRPLIGTRAMRVILLRWPPGFRSVPHVHPTADEAFLVQEGQAIFRMGSDDEVLALPGALLFSPRGESHAIEVVGSEPLVLLSFVSPNEQEVDLPAAGV